MFMLVLSNPACHFRAPASDGATSWQEQFIKRCEKTTTEVEKQSNKVCVGWYSKEDMRTDLKWNANLESLAFDFFPTCQVRVVRFYQSCSSPLPPPPSSSFLLLLLLLLLRVLLLFYHLCLHLHVHCCLANSWPSSSPTSELSAHCWTSTWDLPSSVRTAGPQPGTCRAQCAALTSTWGLPSSVGTAGPQKLDRMPEDMPDRMSDRLREDMPDKMP